MWRDAFGDSRVETNAEHDMQTCRFRLVYEVVNNWSFALNRDNSIPVVSSSLFLCPASFNNEKKLEIF